MVEEIKPGRGVGIAPGLHVLSQEAATPRTKKNVVEFRRLTFVEARGITSGQGFSLGLCYFGVVWRLLVIEELVAMFLSHGPFPCPLVNM